MIPGQTDIYVQIGRRTDSQIARQTTRQTVGRHIARQAVIEPERQARRKAYTQTGGQICRQIDRQTESHKIGCHMTDRQPSQIAS
jgi:hypothetical protein